MHPDLLRLLVLLHLARLVGGQSMPQQPQQAPQKPGKGTPQAQGAHGMAQGFQGSLAPLTGGLGAAKNKAGLFPHQQNPLLMLGLQQRPKL